jgi:hypothetical protein
MVIRRTWFRPWGWIYRPRTWEGFLITILFIAFCVNVFIVVDHQSHSASDTLYGIFPFVAPAFLIWNWIASKTCGGGA